MVAHIAHRLIIHQCIVDTDDHVALLQSSLSSWHIGIRLIDHDAIQLLMLTNQGTDTRILSRQHHSQVLGFILRIILCIRIQAPEHRIDTRADGLFGTQRINIQQFEVLIHLIEDIKMLAHLEVMIHIFLC